MQNARISFDKRNPKSTASMETSDITILQTRISVSNLVVFQQSDKKAVLEEVAKGGLMPYAFHHG